MARGLAVVVLALMLAPGALGDPKTVKPDRPGINRLLDEFIPAVVEQKDLKRGWQLAAGVSRAVSYRQWLAGNTSVQSYPAKGTTFHGWIVNYSYPGDVGFDILLQSRNPKQGAWSFRAEAQRIDGRWRITSWYPVAEFAPPGQVGRVNGPADLGAGAAASAAAGESRLAPWVLAIPLAAVASLLVGASTFAGVRWHRRRRRVRAIEELLASDR